MKAGCLSKEYHVVSILDQPAWLQAFKQVFWEILFLTEKNQLNNFDIFSCVFSVSNCCRTISVDFAMDL